MTTTYRIHKFKECRGPPKILFPARITRNWQYNRGTLNVVLRWSERKVSCLISQCHLTWHLLSRWQHCFWTHSTGMFPLYHGAELILTSLNQLMISHPRKPSCGMMTDCNVPSATDTPEMCMWKERRLETSSRTDLSFCLKGPGVKAVLGRNMWLCIQHCKSKSASCALPPNLTLTNHLLVWSPFASWGLT